MLKRLLFAALLLLSPAANAQTGVQQNGPVTPGHAPYWVTNNVIGDAGPATQGKFSSIGFTNNGGNAVCINSAVITAAYSQVCLGTGTNTPAFISLQNYGGATAPALDLIIGNNTYAIGGTNWLSGILDQQFGSAQGSIIYRNGTIWTALPPGNSGQVLQTLGVGQNLQWAGSGGVGSVTNVATGTGLTGGPIISSGTISLVSPVVVSNGGTGATTLTAHGTLIGEGTSIIATASPGTAGQVLTSNGASSDPTFQSVAGTGTVTSVSGNNGITTSPSSITSSGTVGLAVIGNNDLLANTTGGSAAPTDTALSTLIDAAIGSTRGSILERGSGGWSVLTPGTSGFALISNGAAADPSYQTVTATASQYHRSIFTASGTFTASASVPHKITVCGAGGGGGGTANVSGSASGGGAGGVAIALQTLVNTTVYTIIIGTGGTGGAATGANGTAGSAATTFAGTSTLTANAGSAGIGTTSSTTPNGGAGGAATNGDINISGQAGGPPIETTTTYFGGMGGSPGGGLGVGGASVTGTGSAGTGNCSGGAGGGNGGAGAVGGAGAGGFALIEWWS